MKKFILGAIVALASLSASAQAYIGGSFGFNRDFDKNETEFSILPEVGYNINDSWAAGLEFGYTHEYERGACLNLGRIAPYARWTFFSTSNKLVSLFIDGGIGLNFGTTKLAGVDDSTSDTAFIWNIGIKPGIAFHPTKKFTVLAHLGGLGYDGTNDQGKAWGYTNKFGLNFRTTSLNLGFYYNF